MPHKGTQKIKPERFDEVKNLIAAKGKDQAALATGYSHRTISAIDGSDNYSDWRETRRATSKAPKAKSAPAEKSRSVQRREVVTKAAAEGRHVSPEELKIKSVAPSQPISSRPLPRTTPRPTDFVTRTEVDRALVAYKAEVRRELRTALAAIDDIKADLATAKSAVKAIRQEVKPLVDADNAVRVAEVTLVGDKNFLQRLKDRF